MGWLQTHTVCNAPILPQISQTTHPEHCSEIDVSPCMQELSEATATATELWQALDEFMNPAAPPCAGSAALGALQ